LNASYRFTPELLLAGEYNYTKGKAVRGDIDDQKYKQFSLVLDYLLSKRTDVYTEGTYQTASGTSSTGAAAVADIGALGDSSSNHQLVAHVGMRHRF
jgi:predicted porin